MTKTYCDAKRKNSKLSCCDIGFVFYFYSYAGTMGPWYNEAF